MDTLRESFTLLWEALFLQPAPYAAMRDQKHPARKGLVTLILLGLVLALASFIGTLLAWGGSPNLAEIQAVVLSNLQRMNWWTLIQADPQVEAIWSQVWNGVWQFVRAVVPSPASGIAGFIFRPLALVISWFIFGVAAHLIAKLFSGRGGFAQTLGATSLAAAPQLLGLLQVMPYVFLAGIAVWTFLARYMALRVTHDLSWGRALWVTALTMLLLNLLLFLFFGLGIAAFSSVMAAIFGGG